MRFVRDVMTRAVVSIESDKTALDAAKLMENKGVGCIPVTDPEGKKVVGIMTERDLVHRALAKGLESSSKVGDIMSQPLVTIGSDSSIADAARAMVKYRVRRLVVVDEARLVGIITATDIARALAEAADFTDILLSAIVRHSPEPPPGFYA